MAATVSAPHHGDFADVGVFEAPEDVDDWLAGYGEARLTGTGAAVFAAFDSEGLAQEALAQLPGNMQGVVTRGLNISPVMDML